MNPSLREMLICLLAVGMTLKAGVNGYPDLPIKTRVGTPKLSDTCSNVRSVSSNEVLIPIMFDGRFRLDGTFYTKYTEAYDIPVLGSDLVSDDAMRRACYTLRFLLAGNSKIRQAFYQRWGRVSVIASNSATNSIPEHYFLSGLWDKYMGKGFGSTGLVPVTSMAEEDLICEKSGSTYLPLLHLAYGIYHLAAKQVLPAWECECEEANNQKQPNDQFFATGTVSHFHKIKEHTLSPALRNLLKEVFPCDNTYITPCGSMSTLRQQESNSDLKMNCDLKEDQWTTSAKENECKDNSDQCQPLFREGGCNILTVRIKCCNSCKDHLERDCFEHVHGCHNMDSKTQCMNPFVKKTCCDTCHKYITTPAPTQPECKDKEKSCLKRANKARCMTFLKRRCCASCKKVAIG